MQPVICSFAHDSPDLFKLRQLIDKRSDAASSFRRPRARHVKSICTPTTGQHQRSWKCWVPTSNHEKRCMERIRIAVQPSSGRAEGASVSSLDERRLRAKFVTACPGSLMLRLGNIRRKPKAELIRSTRDLARLVNRAQLRLCASQLGEPHPSQYLGLTAATHGFPTVFG